MMPELAPPTPASTAITDPPRRYTAAYLAAFLILVITTAVLGPPRPGLAGQGLGLLLFVLRIAESMQNLAEAA